MSRKLVVLLCVVALAASGVTLVTAQPAIDAEKAMKLKQKDDPVDRSGPMTKALAEPGRGASPAAREKINAVNIVYDTGVVTAVPATTSLCYGNQFNTALGNPVNSFSVSQLQFYMMPGAGTDNVFVSIFGPVAGTTAAVLTSVSVPLNNGPGAFNTASLGPIAGAGSFLAGVWFIAGDTVGLGAGTVGGQGHHGMVINDIVGTGFATLPSINALVRASTAFIPVELMDFQVVDE